jgi:hypothetical protein
MSPDQRSLIIKFKNHNLATDQTKSESESGSFTIPFYGNPLTLHVAVFKWQ